MARVLLLGGLDPSGGAGISVDATVVTLLGGEPLPVAIATTIQGLRGFVDSAPIDPDIVSQQVATVLADAKVRAVKVGYLGSPAAVALVGELLAPLQGKAKIVLDPVLSATTGGMTSTDDLIAAYREVLVPLADVVTPNTPELQSLAAGDARQLLELGVDAVLHKAGHQEGPQAIDELWTRELANDEPPYLFARERFDCGPVRGTGCALASAIATHLADKQSPVDACRRAGDWLGARLSRVMPRPSGLPRHLPLN